MYHTALADESTQASVQLFATMLPFKLTDRPTTVDRDRTKPIETNENKTYLTIIREHPDSSNNRS